MVTKHWKKTSRDFSNSDGVFGHFALQEAFSLCSVTRLVSGKNGRFLQMFEEILRIWGVYSPWEIFVAKKCAISEKKALDPKHLTSIYLGAEREPLSHAKLKSELITDCSKADGCRVFFKQQHESSQQFKAWVPNLKIFFPESFFKHLNKNICVYALPIDSASLKQRP